MKGRLGSKRFCPNRIFERKLGAFHKRLAFQTHGSKPRSRRYVKARHRRAEETREERISAVVRKAGEETRKVEEIAFYNSLDVENKKAALRERLVSAEQRRAAQVEAGGSSTRIFA